VMAFESDADRPITPRKDMRTPRLRMDRLSKRYGDVVAVDEISLTVENGEFVTLLGPSGSGKTTTLMMIAGFEQPNSGELALDGRSLIGVPAYHRNFGMVFQNYALFPHMTAVENVAFPLRMRGIGRTEREDRAQAALAMVRLPNCAGRYAAQLSGGQQQRVALARSLVFNPPVLLMDEPLGALDKKLREEMQLEIKRIQKEVGITTIYVTHDQEEALVMSDRIAVVNGGRIEQVAPPSVLYERPATRFVANFIGESNIISVELSEEGGQLFARTVDGTQIPIGRATAREVGVATTGRSQPPTCFLIVRPEKIRFGDDARSPDCRLEGVVEDAVYMGDTTRLQIRVGEKLCLLVKRANRAGEATGVIGARCRIAWATDDTVLVES
jgi:putative spermidine/putrescine transport system ATP-binding protein